MYINYFLVVTSGVKLCHSMPSYPRSTSDHLKDVVVKDDLIKWPLTLIHISVSEHVWLCQSINFSRDDPVPARAVPAFRVLAKVRPSLLPRNRCPARINTAVSRDLWIIPRHLSRDNTSKRPEEIYFPCCISEFCEVRPNYKTLYCNWTEIIIRIRTYYTTSHFPCNVLISILTLHVVCVIDRRMMIWFHGKCP